MYICISNEVRHITTENIKQVLSRRYVSHYYQIDGILFYMKVCTRCKLEKEFTEFSKAKNGKNGLVSWCKSCFKQYNFDNKERQYLKNKEYNLKNKESIRIRKNKYCINRKLNDPIYRLRKNVSCLIRNSLSENGYSKKSRTYQILGCSYEEFKVHIENQFTEGMSWDNRSLWHLDHIYPISLAKDEEHLFKLNHYTNFQPLWAADNIRKSNKINN